MTSKAETKYQKYVKRQVQRLLPGCLVLITDPQRNPGIPDLLILYGSVWGMLEVKISESAPFRPNQEYYVEKYNNWSFAATIFPENEEEVLHALQQSLRAGRETCVPQPEQVRLAQVRRITTPQSLPLLEGGSKRVGSPRSRSRSNSSGHHPRPVT